MTTMKIKTKKHGTIEFFLATGGYMYRTEVVDRPGTLGLQLCRNGKYTGPTIRATAASFESACRAWHRQRLAEIRPYNGEY